MERRSRAAVHDAGSRRRSGDNRPACAVGELNGCLLKTGNGGVATSETFAAGLAQDGAAVRRAVMMSLSNARAEGHIGRLKILNRIMCGRASFALLRHRVLLAA